VKKVKLNTTLSKGALDTNDLIVTAIAGMLEGAPCAMFTADGLERLRHEINTTIALGDRKLSKVQMREAVRTAFRNMGYERLQIDLFRKVRGDDGRLL
jgi:hypothetical protein